jgi:hypothetical protein
LTYIVINDSLEEETKPIIAQPKVFQLIELGQPTDFSSKLIQENLFEVYEHVPSVMSQPHFKASVKMKFTLPKVGTWSPPRLPKTQSLIARVKTPCIGVFFILLERS